MFAKALRILSIGMCCLALNTTALAFHTESQGSSEVGFEPAKLIVKFKQNVQPTIASDQKGVALAGIADFDQLNRRYGVKHQKQVFGNSPTAKLHSRLKQVYILTVDEGVDINEMMQKYQELDCVEYAHPNYRVELYDSPDDSLYSHQWYLNNTGQGFYHVERIEGQYNDTLAIVYGTADADIDAHEVYQNPPDATSVIVAIVDTGADLNHPDLAEHLWQNPGEIPGNGIDDDLNGYVDDYQGWDFEGYPFMIPDNDPTDVMGHGTHCSGVVAAMTNNNKGIAGIASNCKIMPLSFYPAIFIEPAAEAIVYAADNGADVISMSFGAPFLIACLEDALNYAAEKDVILVASAGNDGAEVFNYPASFGTTIAVGATDCDDHVTVFSTYGTQISLCAPGQSILSLRAAYTDMYSIHYEPYVHIIDNMYYIASGTSMSGPVVASVAAWLRSISPGISADAAREIIEQTAEDIIDPYGDGSSYPGWDKYSGHGRVNLQAAITAAPQLRAKIASPAIHDQVSGVVDVYGIADGAEFTDYVLDYGFGPTPESWTEIASSTLPVTDDLLGSWDTGSLSGIYTVRLRVGETHMSEVSLYVMNEDVATINAPSVGDTISNATIVSGSAICPDFEMWTLDCGFGSSPVEWDSIRHSTVPASESELGLWTVATLDEGIYTLRLGVKNHTEEVTAVTKEIYVASLFSGDRGWMIDFDTAVSFIPNYGDFDNDGSNEIVLGTASGLYFFNTDGTPKTTGMPSLPLYDFRVPVAVGDLDADGIDDFVAVSADPPKLYGCPSTEPDFEVDLAEAPWVWKYQYAPGHGSPVLFLMDVNNDGKDEIHYATGYMNDPVNTYIFNPDGTPFTLPVVSSPNTYLPADLDGDGIKEIYALDGDTLKQHDHVGQVINSFVFESEGQIQPDGLSAVDVDDDGKHELVFWGVFLYSLSECGNYTMWLFDENLVLKPGWPNVTNINGCFGQPDHPIFADIDSDGILEYLAESGVVYAWNLDGTPYGGSMSETAVFVRSSNPSTIHPLTILDIDGDGEPEIVTTETPTIIGGYDKQDVLAWNNDRSICDDWPLYVGVDLGHGHPETHTNLPVMGDVDSDGILDLFMTTRDRRLVFTELPGILHSSSAAYSPYWRYNRSMDNTLPIKSFGGCGNVDGLGDVDIDDVVYIIMYIFSGGPAPNPIESGDVNCSGDCDIDDVVYLITYIFSGGYAPCDIDGDGNPDC